MKGECRSHDDARLAEVAAGMVDALQLGATEVGVDVDIDLATEYRSFALTGRSPVVRLAKQTFAALGIDVAMVSAGGGSDANILNERGIPTVNLGCGMTGVHAAGETQSLDDLVQTAAVALALMRQAGRHMMAESARGGGRDAGRTADAAAPAAVPTRRACRSGGLPARLRRPGVPRAGRRGADCPMAGWRRATSSSTRARS